MMSGGRMMMLPGMRGYVPPMEPFLPGRNLDPTTLPTAMPSQVIRMNTGDTLLLRAGFVSRTINGRTFAMYGFNNQYPGPMIRVSQGSEIVVDFENDIDMPTSIHWHGLRHDNRYDGVPGVTQEAIAPGENFVYHVRFPDAGIYWYHPHSREDIQQELGLYGNMLADSPNLDYFNPVNREEFLILDDILLENGEIAPFGKEHGNYSLMGRFGNVMLVNGEPDYSLDVAPGEVVRFYITNVSNARMFNLSFGAAAIKVVGGDIGRFEREQWSESVVIAPAERYVVEVLFDRSGEYQLLNRFQTIDHFLGQFYGQTDTLGSINSVGETPAATYHDSFEQLRTNSEVISEIDGFRRHFSREPDHELQLSIRVGELPQGMIQFMSIDTAYYAPAEWTNSMPMMNWVSNTANTEWVLRDPATGRENMDIGWTANTGDVLKIRFHNDPESFHPMSHPIHLHGQRFLVVERNGVPNPNLVWKETVLVPVGATVDVLVDITNPGTWMIHCHIAEHLEAGMMTSIQVQATD